MRHDNLKLERVASGVEDPDFRRFMHGQGATALACPSPRGVRRHPKTVRSGNSISKSRRDEVLPKRYRRHPSESRNLVREKSWLPGMDSNHELDKFLKCRNLPILKSLQSHPKHQNHDLGTKSVQSGCAPSVNSSVNQKDRAIKPGKCLASCGRS